MPTNPDSGLGAALTGLVASIAVLSGGAFLVLRQITRRSLRQMDRDNHRLAALLAASSSLSTAEHGRDAAVTAVRSALAIAEARAAFVLVPGESGRPPGLLVSAGADAEKLHEAHGEAIDEVAELVLREGRPALAGESDGISRLRRRPAAGRTGAARRAGGDPDRGGSRFRRRAGGRALDARRVSPRCRCATPSCTSRSATSSRT